MTVPVPDPPRRAPASVAPEHTASRDTASRDTAGPGRGRGPGRGAARSGAAPAAQVDGLVVVDKPAGWTSHDVVARARRVLGQRRIGHAGTLDPMATGVLLLGAGRGTRLLGHLALTDKVYEATIRLGRTTTTDDAEGEPVEDRPVDVDDAALARAMAALTGPLDQVPASVSAVKVGGVRAYARVRAGEQVELAARRVTVSRFDLRGRRAAGQPADPAGQPGGGSAEPAGPPCPDRFPAAVGAGRAAGPSWTDLDVTVACSSGTYVRALARDLGAALGCGAHLTALRRTAVGPFALTRAVTLDTFGQLGAQAVAPLADAVAAAFERRDVSAAEAVDVAHGRRLPPVGRPGTYGVFGPDGRVLALVEESGQAVRSLVVFAPA